MEPKPRISIVMPCFGRPQRTQRAIKSIKAQTVKDFEAFILWDNCPKYNYEIIKNDDRFVYGNTVYNWGKWGWYQLNNAIRWASGTYFCFLDNDNTLLPNHFENYLSQIENTDLDFVYFDLLVYGKKWKTKLAYSRIDQGAVIVKTETLKRMPPQSPIYWKDWEMVQHLLASGAKFKKSKTEPTYHIMSNAENRIDFENLD